VQSTPSPRSPEAGARSIVVALAWTGAVLAALTVAFGLASLAGEPVRASALVATDAPLPDAALTYADAPDAGRFFDARDTVTVTVPWNMTVAEFLALYHMENNADARRALREQHAADGEADRLEAGTEVSFHLTERSPAR
jgi:hypothetical protein